MKKRTLLPVAVLLLPVLAWPAAAAPDVRPRTGWKGLHTANFYVIGDAGDREIRQVARRLEQFRDTLGILFPKAPLGSVTPTTVLVFKTHRSYEPVKPLYQGKAKDVVGFFQPGTMVNYITLTTEDGFQGLGITYHEYVHLVVNNTVQNMPLWFNEGLADYYSSFEVSASGDRATLGKVVVPHLLLLREQWVPLEQIAEVDHQSPLYNESNKMSVFYAESWAFVHYLLLGNEHQFGSKVGQFVAALINGTPFDTACQQSLGMTSAALERELKLYVNRELFRSQQARFADRLEQIDKMPLAPVAEADVHATIGDLMVHMNRRDVARAELDAALALDPDNGPAHASLAMLAIFDHDLAAARPELEKAVASPSATYLCHYYYALTLANARRAGAALTDAESGRIEPELRRAIALNPDYPDSHAQLAWQLGQSDVTRAEAGAEMEKAMALAPGREEYTLGLASILANAQDYERSRSLLSPLASHAADASVRRQASELLASILEFEKRRAAWEASRAGRAPAPGPPSADTTSEDNLPTESPATRRGQAFQPLLRHLNPGESRMPGTLTAIDCGPNGIVLVVNVNGSPVRVSAPAFDAVDFISYRTDLKGQIQCGPRKPADQVLLTFRPVPAASGGMAGTAVAVEFVPAGFSQ